jgi:hypothetical protein
MSDYPPINVGAYTSAYSGAIAGMTASGWITDGDPSDYELLTQIAGTYAQVFDQLWNNSSQLNILEQSCITTVITKSFQDRQPGPLSDPQYLQASTWTENATACRAVVWQSDAFFAAQGITIPTIIGLPTATDAQVLIADSEGNYLSQTIGKDGAVDDEGNLTINQISGSVNGVLPIEADQISFGSADTDPSDGLKDSTVTTNATPVNILNKGRGIALGGDQTANVYGSVTGVDSPGGFLYKADFIYTVYRLNGASAVMSPSSPNLQNIVSVGANTFAITFSLSLNTILINVTGMTGQTVTWSSKVVVDICTG